MRATYWLIGCVVCIAGLGSAAAATLDAQDLNTSTHAATRDSESSRESNTSSTGDVLGLSHDSSSVSTSSNDTPGSSSGSGNDHSGTTSHARTPSRRPNLGWQSLLPGSIQ